MLRDGTPAISTIWFRFVIGLLLMLVLGGPAHAQRSVRITGDRLSGVVLPVEPLAGGILLQALRATVWTVDDTQRLILEGDVLIRIGPHEFTADAAAVWLNRIPSARGTITQIAVYFENLENSNRSSGVGLGGTELLVTGSALAEVDLTVSLVEKGRPSRQGGLLREGERRLAMHLRRVIGEPPPPLSNRPQAERAATSQAFVPRPGGPPTSKVPEWPTSVVLPSDQEREPRWLRKPGSRLQIAFGTVKLEPGPDENTITVTDSIVIEYRGKDLNADIAQLTLAADQAVVFTDPGTLEDMSTWDFDAEIVRGIYLEGNVTASANDGDAIARAPRMYFDFNSEQAIMLNAILRTYDRSGQIPVFARAQEMRQIAQDQWEANEVRVTTSEFAVGHLALGADRMTMTRRPTRDDPQLQETFLEAEGIALEAGGMPFFRWPSFQGTVQDIPLRSVTIGASDSEGVIIKTGWDAYALLGREAPDGVDAELKIEGFTDRGAAIGLDIEYDTGIGTGLLDLYGLYDEGTDRTSSGEDVEPAHDFRGVALLEHSLRMDSEWSMQLQTSYISDETFISSWREDDYTERLEYETSIYLKKQTDQTAFTLLGKYQMGDFLSNDYLLASQAYTVEKLPEARYLVVAKPIFGDRATYSAEYSASRMRIAAQDSTPNEIGVPGAAFGIGDDDSIADSLGLSSSFVTRLDTRHELAWPTRIGFVNLTPFVVGRLTAYDEDLENEPQSDDTLRAFGSVGIRIGGEFQRIDNTVESRAFDLHRMRQIIRPSMTLWHASSDVTETDLPIYDYDVESLTTGSMARFGIESIWQTQRGGPGRWRSVDVLKMNADLVLHSGDVDDRGPIPQFFDDRPELSQAGDHVETSVVWLLSDSFTVSGESIIDVDDSLVARGAFGAELRHSPDLTTFAEYRYIDASDNQLLDVGWNYKLTEKYRVSFSPQWDFQEDEFRAVNLRVVRGFPDFDLTVRVKHDEIRDDTSIGATIGLVEF